MTKYQINMAYYQVQWEAWSAAVDIMALVPPPPPPPPPPLESGIAEYVAAVSQWAKDEMVPAMEDVVTE